MAAFAGLEHGVGELTQPNTDPGSLLIESWPHVAAFESLGGEPAVTLIPDLRVAGVVTVLSSLALGWWVEHRQQVELQQNHAKIQGELVRSHQAEALRAREY